MVLFAESKNERGALEIQNIIFGKAVIVTVKAVHG